MTERIELDAENLSAKFDWTGNNAPFTCPACENVFIVSGFYHTKGKLCSECGRWKGYVEGSASKGARAWIEKVSD